MNNLKKQFTVVRIMKLFGTERIFITLRFNSPVDESPKEVTIPISDARQRSKLRDIIPESFAIKDVRASHQVVYIQQEIHDAMAETKEFSFLLPQGFSRIGGQWVYTLGDRILNQPASHKMFAYNPLDRHPATVEKNSAQEWNLWIKTYFEQGPGQTVMFIGALVPFAKPLLTSLGYPETVNVYVCGESGTGKTEFSKLLTNIYGLSSTNGINLSCNKNEILEKHFLEGKDRCFFVDDLNLSCSSREAEKKKERLSELIQMSSSGGDSPADLSGTVLLITAEYLLPSASTINRCIVAEFESPFDPANLTYLQKKQQLYSCFLQEFLIWVCQNYEHLCQIFKSKLEHNPEMLNYRGAHDSIGNYSGFSRVMRSCRILNLTRLILDQFLRTKTPEKTHEKICGLACEGITIAVANTLKYIRKEPLSPCMERIISIFQDDRHGVVASSYEKYCKKEKKVFFRYNDVFCFRSKKLFEFLSKHIETSFNKQTAPNQLKKFGLLKKQKADHLPSSLRKKHDDYHNYYQLSVPALIDLLRDRYPDDVFAFVNSPIEELKPYKQN